MSGVDDFVQRLILPSSGLAHEIQAVFFRTGPRTRLWIDPSIADGNLRWRFDFMDLGMFHCVQECVPIRIIPAHAPALFVFGGRFCAYMRTLYLSARIEPVGCHGIGCDFCSGHAGI